MYVYEYLSLQKRLEELKIQMGKLQPLSVHVRLIDETNLTIFKIKKLKLISNN